jgi:epoxyqueuosine reductase
MARNAAIVSGNRRDAEAVPALRQALKNDDPVVRGAVVWALGKIATPEARQLLQELQQTELDLQVLEEIRQALPQAAHKT